MGVENNMSKIKNQTVYFYQLSIKGNSNDITLEKILKKFLEENLNKTFSVKKNEKEIWINEVFDSEKDFLFFKYEVSNFGTRENIKDRTSRKEVGHLGENQYLEKFQCILLRKKDKNNYDVVFQNVQYGVRFYKFFIALKSFFEKIKKENIDEFKNIDLVYLIFYQLDFINKINQIKNFKKMTIDGKVSNSPEFNYAGIETKDNEIEIKTHHVDIIQTKFNKPYLIPVNTLKKLLEDQFKKYDKVKIILEGEGEQQKSLKLLSEDIQITTKIKVEKLEGNILSYLDLKRKMIKSFDYLDSMSVIAVEAK